MKRLLLTTGVVIAILGQSVCYANWFSKIADLIKNANKINSGILNTEMASLNVQRDILSSQKELESLMKQVNGNMTSHSGWGTYQSHDYQSYGSNATNWSNVMRMAESGRGDGYLGHVIGGMANQFPADKNTYNRGVSDTQAQNYYAIKSQTILATRAASQLDYDKIQDQIQYQQMLQHQIENTKDLKAAVDLNNRLQVESNLINLGVLRQVLLSNQQQAITEQASVNTALSNAKFLTKP